MSTRHRHGDVEHDHGEATPGDHSGLTGRGVAMEDVLAAAEARLDDAPFGSDEFAAASAEVDRLRGAAPVPAAENPTNPTATTEASTERTRQAPRLDIPKEAIWKSVPGATGGFGCERETFYREVVRDDRGYRLRFGASENMIVGVAIDRLHGWLMNRRMDVGPADASMLGWDISAEGEGLPLTEDMLREDAVAATLWAMEGARARDTDQPWSDEDWDALAQSVGLAAEKLLGLWPNRVKPRTVKGEVVEWIIEPEPEGTPDGPPIGWLDTPEVVIQPQRKMYVPGVVGGRGISGQPDYVFVRDGTIVGWVDVKALRKAGSFPAKWTAGEAVCYDYLCTHENGGVPPEWHGYLEYRRVTKPYWALIVAPVALGSVSLARSYFARWERALDGGDPDALSFNPKSCAGCQYREAIPEVGFDGCPIGEAVLSIAPEAIDE